MYKGFILSESLADPTVLNSLKQIYVKVEKHTENVDLPIWHDFKVSIGDNEIEKVTALLAEQMKPTWYAHFWNETEVYVVLPHKVFKIPREKKWQSKQYQECKEYAVKNGVEERYLNFGLED